MKNGIETRPNGAVITKAYAAALSVSKSSARLRKEAVYYVGGSPNGPWDLLRNARADADAMREIDGQVLVEYLTREAEFVHVRVLAHSLGWAAEMVNRGAAHCVNGSLPSAAASCPSIAADFCEVPK